jgi:hypothetical protein
MILSIKNLHKTFPKEEGEMVAIDDFNLDVEEGEFVLEAPDGVAGTLRQGRVRRRDGGGGPGNEESREVGRHDLRLARRPDFSGRRGALRVKRGRA